MKKLRLIKPWDLHPVYQKATARPEIDETFTTLVCQGPQAPDADDSPDDRRGPSPMNSHYASAGIPAPESRIIFAAVTNPRMG